MSAVRVPALFALSDYPLTTVEYERLRHIYSKTDVGELAPRVKPAVTREKKTQ